MGLQVYYPADICNALLAAEQAVNATALATGSQDDPFTSGFLTGYRAALTTLALAFGLPPRSSALSLEREPNLLAVAFQQDPLFRPERA
jgi:hypothetical protein